MQTHVLSFAEKQELVKKLFLPNATAEARYQKIIELGRSLPPLSAEFKIPENIVSGCQSILYLRTEVKDGKIFFEAASEALISAGLAALLLAVYNGESPETILKASPDYIRDLGIHASLSPSRSNGLSSMYLRMRQEALQFLIKT